LNPIGISPYIQDHPGSCWFTKKVYKTQITNTKIHKFILTHDPLILHKTYQKPCFLLSFSIFIDMEIEKKFYVYVDFRGDDGRPFYVGKGIEGRVKDLERNVLHTNIKKKHGIIREVVFETHSEQESFEKEIQLIQELRTHIDFREGGANLTFGGEGVSGYKYTKEQREKLWDNPEHIKKLSKKMRESIKKKWEDPVFRKKHEEKMQKTSKKLWEDPEHKEKMSESRKKMWEDPEYRENHSEKLKKAWENPEHKEKVSKLIKDHHSDPEFRKKQGKKMREVLSDPEIREKISKITKEKLSDPEVRKKMSENTKLGLAKLTPEQRSERTRLGWETRRLKKLQQEV